MALHSTVKQFRNIYHVYQQHFGNKRKTGRHLISAPLYLRTLWHYTNAVIIIIIINKLIKTHNFSFVSFYFTTAVVSSHISASTPTLQSSCYMPSDLLNRHMSHCAPCHIYVYHVFSHTRWLPTSNYSPFCHY